MGTELPKQCPKHVNDLGSLSADERETISAFMDKFPDNQGFPGRHKCAYCSYVEGIEVGYALALAEVERSVRSLRSCRLTRC